MFEPFNKVFILKTTEHNIGREFVKLVAAKTLGIAENEIGFGEIENGKPVITGQDGFYFNISHSKNYLAVAFGNSPVGVDIEEERPVNLKIANKFFTKDEAETVTDEKSFLRVWTKKEAYIKYTGEGFKKPLSSFNSLEIPFIKTFCGEDYFLSVCSADFEKFRIEKIDGI